MKMKWYFLTFTVVAFVLGMMNTGRSAEVLFKDYDAVIVENLNVPTGSPAPESSGLQMAEKAVYQLNRYSEKYKLFDMVVKEGSKSKEVPAGKKVLVIKGEVKEYTTRICRETNRPLLYSRGRIYRHSRFCCSLPVH